jgi:hypothetical protein
MHVILYLLHVNYRERCGLMTHSVSGATSTWSGQHSYVGRDAVDCNTTC